MKLDCGETWEEQKRRLSNWHRKFAWFPISIADHDYRWLEWVERRGTYSSTQSLMDGYTDTGWTWEYREIKNG